MVLLNNKVVDHINLVLRTDNFETCSYTEVTMCIIYVKGLSKIYYTFIVLLKLQIQWPKSKTILKKFRSIIFG